MDAVRKCSAQDKQQIKCRWLVAWKKRRRQKYVKVSIMHDDVVGEPGEKLAKFVDFLTFRCQELDSIFLHCRFSLATFVLNRSAWWCEKRNINPMSSSTSVATIGAYGCSTVSNKGRRRNWKEGWRPAMTTTGNATKSPAQLQLLLAKNFNLNQALSVWGT